MSQSTIQIVPVTNRRELDEFILFPFKLYRDDPLWVPPIISERRQHYDPHHNPFFEHAEMRMFRAVRDGETVGTIAAIDDQLHPQVWDEPVGFFGLFETIEDPSVAAALFDAARAWLAERGREIMRGPMNININDECGMLIQGFDGPPVVMMTYNPQYYPTFMDEYGFTKAKDLRAYIVDLASFGPNLENLPARVKRVAQIARDRYKVTFRPVNMAHLDEDLEMLKPIHREAWNQNWGALPMSDAEFAYLEKSLKPVLDADLSYLAFIDGQPVGVFVVLPDYCQVAIHMNGRLFPFGWAQFLWHKRKINGMRVLIMGVLAEHRLKGIEALFYEEACRTAIRKGYKWSEMSWTLEDNHKVNRGIEMMGAKHYRSYRIYDIPTKEG